MPVSGAISVCASPVVLSAMRKVGKTTSMGNLVRSLVDGSAFLDRFTLAKPVQRVVLIDLELSKRMVRRWLREQGITSTDAVTVYPMRGKAGTLNLLEPETRSRWAAQIGAAGRT